MRSFAEDRVGAVCILKVDQPIDRDHASEIEEWADDKLAGGDRFLLLNCLRSTCFDSIGLEAMLSITRQAASQGARFALTHLNENLATTLRVTRLEKAIEHYLTVEDAVRALRGRGA